MRINKTIIFLYKKIVLAICLLLMPTLASNAQNTGESKIPREYAPTYTPSPPPDSREPEPPMEERDGPALLGEIARDALNDYYQRGSSLTNFYAIQREFDWYLHNFAMAKYDRPLPEYNYEDPNDMGFDPGHFIWTWMQSPTYKKLVAEDPEINELKRKFRQWARFVEPRLCPIGEFVNMQALTYKAIQQENTYLEQIRKNDRNTRNVACNISANWKNIGPFFSRSNTTNYNTNPNNSYLHHLASPGTGRINCLKKHPTQNIIYLGASTGGLWKSTDVGVSWQPIGQETLPNLGVSEIEFNKNADTMYLATGDNSDGIISGAGRGIGNTTYSIGVLYSTDAGNTWKPLADSITWEVVRNGITYKLYHNKDTVPLKITKMIVNSKNELLIATNYFSGNNGSEVTRNPGIWKYKKVSAIEGKWQLMQLSSQATVTDMVILPKAAPNGTDDIIIACQENGKYIFRSEDSGHSFIKINSPNHPATGTVNAHLSVDNSGVVYMITASQTGFKALFYSTNKGLNFSIEAGQPAGMPSKLAAFLFHSTTDSRFSFAAHPTQTGVLYIAGTKNVWQMKVDTVANSITQLDSISLQDRAFANGKYKDGNYVHVDMNELIFLNNPDTLWAAHDGGVSYCNLQTQEWSNWHKLCTDLCITQCYNVSGLNADTGVVFVGTQDNGTYRQITEPSTPHWIGLLGGDDFEIQLIDKQDMYLFFHPRKGSTPLYKFKTIDNYHYTLTESNFLYPNFSQFLKTSFVKHPTLHNTIFVGGLDVYKSTDGGTTFVATNAFYYHPLSSNSQNRNTIHCIAIFQSNPDIMYAAKRDSLGLKNLISYTDNGGSTWQEIPTDSLPKLFLNQIVIHPSKPGTIWAVFSGFNAQQKVYQSTDTGKTWKNISGILGKLRPHGASDKISLPNVPVNCAVAYHQNPADTSSVCNLLVGTDIGVYYTNTALLKCNSGAQWLPFSTNLPRTIIQDIEVNGTTDDRLIRVATYGRGVWQTPIPTSADVGSCLSATDCSEHNYPITGFNTIVTSVDIKLQPTVFISNTDIIIKSPIIIPNTTLEVYDIFGTKKGLVFEGQQLESGNNIFNYSANELTPGIYFFILKKNNNTIIGYQKGIKQ